MDPEATVETVVDAGVVSPSADGETFELAPQFRDAVAERRDELEALSPAELDARVENAVGDGPDAAPLSAVCAENAGLLAALEVLAETDDVPREARLDVLPAVDQFLRDPPREDGTPEGFVTIHADLLPLYVHRVSKGIVFVWREHCPSCRTMREEFETLFETPPEDVALLSVYGPAHAEFLLDQYDVQGGPTTLFVRDGRIDVRLLGAQHREVIEQELAYLRDD